MLSTGATVRLPDESSADPHSDDADDAPAHQAGAGELVTRPSESLRGLALMLGAVLGLVAMATTVKILREHGMSTLEVMLWRMAPGVPWLYFELRRRGIAIRPHRPLVIALRCTFGGLAMGLYFWAISRLTLLQHTVLYLTQPVFVALIAPAFLRERLRGAALLALVLALGGAAVVVLPGGIWTGDAAALGAMAVPLLPALAGIGAAVMSAAAHVTIRRATTTRLGEGAPADSPELVVFYFSGCVALACATLGLATGALEGPPGDLSFGTTFALIVFMATTGMVAQLLMSRAYAHTSAPTVAIVGYTRIPTSMLADTVVWGAAAGATGWAGGALMVVAGILLVRRDPRAGPRDETA